MKEETHVLIRVDDVGVGDVSRFGDDGILGSVKIWGSGKGRDEVEVEG